MAQRVVRAAGTALVTGEVVEQDRLVGEAIEPLGEHLGAFLEAARLVVGKRATEDVPALLDAEQAAQLRDRLGVVVHPQVANAVDPLVRALAGTDALDQHRGGLLSTPVAAGALRGLERSDEALGELAARRAVRKRHVPHDRLTREQVPLGGEPFAHFVPGPVVALAAGVRRRGAGGGDDAELARLAAVVGGERLLERGLRLETLGEQPEDARAEGRDPRRLRGDGADSRFRPWHDRTDGEILGLDGDPDLARLRVGRDDRERGRAAVHADRRRWMEMEM